MPFSRRWRYVARVVREVWARAVAGAVGVAVSDPAAAPEATARTGKDEAAWDDRPRARVPRRACSAMVHLFRPRPLLGPVSPWYLIRRRPHRTGWTPLRMLGDGPIGRRMLCLVLRAGDDPAVPCRPVLQERGPVRSEGVAGRLADVRVRIIELRLIAAGLIACWTVTGLVVLAGYRPGGPVDLAVGLAAAGPVAIALAGFIWPPSAQGTTAFAAMVWLGLGSLLVLVPSIVDVSDQLV